MKPEQIKQLMDKVIESCLEASSNKHGQEAQRAQISENLKMLINEVLESACKQIAPYGNTHSYNTLKGFSIEVRQILQ